MKWIVPLSNIEFGPEEKNAVCKVLDSGWLTMGAVTQKFEEEFAAYTGAKHAFAVSNATVALHMVCLALDIGPGDEVIVPSLTFVATANAICYTGATPVFADIVGENDLTVSLEAMQKLIAPNTKAIIVMHYGGYTCDMPRIMAWANENHLAVIEDAAHAVGSYLDGKHLGTWGAAGCYSFFSNKNLSTGEGGMIVTDDDALAEKFPLLRSHGMTSLTWDRHQGHAWSYDVATLGYNYRIDEIHSALGREQLRKLDGFNARRREITALYRELLNELTPEIVVPFDNHPGISAHHIMPVVLPKGANRLHFMEKMKEQGIQTSIHYPPIHLFSSFKPLVQRAGAFLAEAKGAERLQVTEDIASREVTLPLYPLLTDDQVELVVQSAQKSLMPV
ncbi:MAG: DegT/DnrJ/EryC1/StrS aminotransferase [Anaerolinea sp.]|nr:DegT/DnrJ/EryC1/StrS aminotransferase [Anaerolinea sp.]